MNSYEIHYFDEESLIEKTENRGYWKQGTVIAVLESGERVWTPFAEFRRAQLQDTGGAL